MKIYKYSSVMKKKHFLELWQMNDIFVCMID